MDYTIDRALTYSILKGGISAFQQAKELGVSAEHLKFEDQQVFRLCEDVFIPMGKIPSLAELRVNCGIDLPESPDSFDVGLCSKDIVKRALSTALNDGLGPIAEQVWSDPYGSRDKLNELIQKTTWSSGTLVRTNSPATIDEVKRLYLEAKGRTGSLLGYSSPWPSRDKQSLGLQKGEVTCILAKRKTGKSWFLFKWAEHIWTAKKEDGTPELGPGECIMIITMEMPVWQVLRRFFAINQKLNYEEFRAGRLTKAEEDKYFAWCDEMKKPSTKRPDVIVVGSDKVRTVADIIALNCQYKPKAIFIDGFYILETERGGKAPMWERVETVIKDIKLKLAIAHAVPVVATTQLSGQVKRGDLNAEADAVAYAKSIGNYADSIDGLFGNDKFRDSRKRILRGMEARDFITVDLEINFDPGTQDYSEIKVIDKKDDGSDSGDESSESDDPGDPGSAPGYSEAEITLD